MRWWKEWKYPTIKCGRVGHKMGIEYRKGYVTPQDYRNYVCERVRQERDVCTRCTVNFSDWRTTEREGFTGYSWPADQASEFKKNGAYWTSHGFA